VGLGADLVRVERLAQALARHPGLRDRLYTSREIAYCELHREPAARFAARFAAKEAVLKALGTGLGRGMRWRDVEVVHGARQQPEVRLHGQVAALAARLGVRAVQLALSHEGGFALACAITEPLSLAAPDAGAEQW
jgi:holo-[acyl-carrier protein] synthase